MPAGRPSDYEPRYAKMAFDLLCEGASITEVGWHLRRSQQTIAEWRAKFPEFGDAIKLGVEISKGAWESWGRVNVGNKDFNSTLWYMNMKNRFGWRDKVENTHQVQISHEDSLKQLE